uniref:Uncharacterized protein n=1 Tax=Arundo donax TaxID=35708 RepID=A0A0A9BCP3_ARUDO
MAFRGEFHRKLGNAGSWLSFSSRTTASPGRYHLKLVSLTNCRSCICSVICSMGKFP